MKFWIGFAVIYFSLLHLFTPKYATEAECVAEARFGQCFEGRGGKWYEDKCHEQDGQYRTQVPC